MLIKMNSALKDNYDVIVIGGGAAGLIAAGEASLSGAKVLLLEKKSALGRKLRITGKGRCNLTNTAPLREFIQKFGKNGRFLYQAFDQFFSDDLVLFLGSLGLNIKKERGGRIFPEGEDAVAVTKALIGWVKKSGTTIKTNTTVTKILVNNNKVTGLYTKDASYVADKIIICTGGKSYPATGSTGDGYKFAKALGHTIIPPRPALVPIITEGMTAKHLQGLSLKNVNVSVIVDNTKRAEAFGEMLFTHYGLSGPIILTLSRVIVDAFRDKKNVEISIDLKPALDDEKIESRLLRSIKEGSNKNISSLLKDLLPGKLVNECASLLKLHQDKKCHQISTEERKRLRLWLKDFRFKVSGHRAYEEAIVTAGGVNLKEVNPRTMESKIVGGLYLAGEVLDIDGETGGFNLQAAFSTGYLAGHSVVKK